MCYVREISQDKTPEKNVNIVLVEEHYITHGSYVQRCSVDSTGFSCRDCEYTKYNSAIPNTCSIVCIEIIEYTYVMYTGKQVHHSQQLLT
jgi:hypothetical protein